MDIITDGGRCKNVSVDLDIFGCYAQAASYVEKLSANTSYGVANNPYFEGKTAMKSVDSELLINYARGDVNNA